MAPLVVAPPAGREPFGVIRRGPRTVLGTLGRSRDAAGVRPVGYHARMFGRLGRKLPQRLHILTRIGETW